MTLLNNIWTHDDRKYLRKKLKADYLQAMREEHEKEEQEAKRIVKDAMKQRKEILEEKLKIK